MGRAGAEHLVAVRVLISLKTSEDLLARELYNLLREDTDCRAKRLGNGKKRGLPPRAVVFLLCPPHCVSLSTCAAMGEMDWGPVGEKLLMDLS